MRFHCNGYKLVTNSKLTGISFTIDQYYLKTELQRQGEKSAIAHITY
jgi:hypothetical protein